MNILQQIASLLGVKLTKVHEKTVANKEAIEAEVKRAQASETLLDTNIKNETKRAHDEEARIELKAVDLVTKEETRATAAEKVNSDAISALDKAYKAADTSLSNRITTEVSERKAADTALDEKKVDKVEGKQLSTEDYTTTEKTKVGNLEKYTTSTIYERNIPGSQDMYLEYKVKNPETGEIQTYDTILHKVNDTHNGLMTPAQKMVIDNLLSGDSALSILGTPSSTWQLNLGSGPKIKNSGGIFELRNADDNAYADLTVNALTIKGNVTQEGGSFITQAETVSAKDNTILLNSGETGAGVTKGEAGVEIDRGTLPKYKFVFDESDDRFKVGSEGDLWSVMLRDNETDLTDKGILTWDATTKRAKTAFNIDDLSDKYLPLAGGTMTGNLILSTSSRIYTKYIGGMAAILAGGSNSVSIGNANLITTIRGAANIKHQVIDNSGNTIDYTIWDSGNDGADSGLDADLLDGQHGSYYAKATDLDNYIPLSGTIANKPITGMFEVNDNNNLSQVGFYGKSVEHSDEITRSTRLLFTNIVGADAGGDPGCIVSLGCFGTNNYRSMLIVGHLKHRPMLRFDYHDGDSTSQLKRAEVYHEGNLDITKFALKTDLDNIDLSGYLPLSGGTMSGLLSLIKGNSSIAFVDKNGAAEALIGYSNPGTAGVPPSFLLGSFQSGAETSFIGQGGLFYQNGSDKYKMWHGGNDGAGSGLDADLLDGKQGSEYALASHVPSLGGLFRFSIIKVGGDNNHFYPCTWLETNGTAYISIHSRGAGGADPYNQNQITFLASLNGGSDMPKNIRVLESNLYEYSEVTIHSIYYGNENGNNCIYLRGGLTYTVWSNVTITPNINGFTSGNESFGIMDSSYNVTTAAATKAWTYENGITIAYANRGAAVYLADAGAPDSNNIQLAYAGTGLEPSQVTHILAFDNRETGTTRLARDFSIDKLKTRLGSLPANGGNADTAGNGMFTLYPYSSNELNFGGTGVGTDIYIGYRSVQGRPLPTTYRFGSTSNGTATLYAANFILAGKQVATTDQIPSSLPASDVYAWAKASAKPSYAWGEIVSKPTNLSTAGINDGVTSVSVTGSGNAITTASISGHILTLNKGTAFLTSHQSLANYVTLNTTQTITGAKTFSAFVTCSAGAGTSSDIRLKKYINRMFDAEEILSNLSGYRYVMKETDMHYAGLIAQEVQEVLPEAVREDEKGFLTVDTYPIVAALVEANKAKDNRIKALEDRLSALEKKMSIILNRMGE